jgi:hypothetical protein
MKRPEHLFVASADGHLYDTRETDWSKKPLRQRFERSCHVIQSVADLKATLREGQWIWPGGYPLFFITSDGGVLSFEAVRQELRSVMWSIRRKVGDGWRVVACEANYEEPDLFCDHLGCRIPSAYAEDRTEDALDQNPDLVF